MTILRYTRILSNRSSVKGIFDTSRPGLTAMVKHDDHAMIWHDHGDSFSPWYGHGKIMPLSL